MVLPDECRTFCGKEPTFLGIYEISLNFLNIFLVVEIVVTTRATIAEYITPSYVGVLSHCALP